MRLGSEELTRRPQAPGEDDDLDLATAGPARPPSAPSLAVTRTCGAIPLRDGAYDSGAGSADQSRVFGRICIYDSLLIRRHVAARRQESTAEQAMPRPRCS